MTGQTAQKGGTGQAFAVYYVYLPTVFHLLIAAICLLYGAGLAQTAWLLYLVAALTLIAALSGYLAYFEDRVRNLVALLSALVNGALTITIFAALHRTAGIVCGSSVCTGTRAAEVSRLSRIAPPEATTDLCTQAPCVEIYTDLLTALYFSTVTFTTLGYGDLQPVPQMRALAGFEAVVGYIFLGFLVGTAFHWGTNARSADQDCAHCRAEMEAGALNLRIAELEQSLNDKSNEVAALKQAQEHQQSRQTQSPEPDPKPD
jgi:hypothetical protein